jgi:hypothetical protein
MVTCNMQQRNSVTFTFILIIHFDTLVYLFYSRGQDSRGCVEISESCHGTNSYKQILTYLCLLFLLFITLIQSFLWSTVRYIATKISII